MDYSEYYDDYVNYDYWLLRDSWRLYESCLLLCGLDPCDYEKYNNTPRNNQGRLEYFHNNRTREMESFIKSSITAKTIKGCSGNDNCFYPMDIIKWAMDKGFINFDSPFAKWYEKKSNPVTPKVIAQLDIEKEIYRLMAIENESLKKQLETGDQSQTINNKEISEDLEKSYLKIIGALLEVINGTAPPKSSTENTKIRQHPSFTSQADLVVFIAENETYKKARGLGKTSLDIKFANARKTLNESLK